MTRNTYHELYILKSFLNKEKKGIQTECAFKKKIKIFEGAIGIEFFLKINNTLIKILIENNFINFFVEFFSKVQIMFLSNRLSFEKIAFEIFFSDINKSYHSNIENSIEKFITTPIRDFKVKYTHAHLINLANLACILKFPKKLKLKQEFLISSLNESKSFCKSNGILLKTDGLNKTEIFLFEKSIEQIRLFIDRKLLIRVATLINSLWYKIKIENIYSQSLKSFFYELIRYFFFHNNLFTLSKFYYAISMLENKAKGSRVDLDIVLAMFFLITNSYFTKHCSFKKLINYEIFKNPSLSYLYKKLENFLSNYYMFSKKSIFQYLDKNSWKIPRLSIKKIFLSLKAAVILKKLNFFFKRSTCISYHHASKIFELDYRDLENWINELNRTNVMKIKIDKINSFIFKF
jgi:hypothetical protein